MAFSLSHMIVDLAFFVAPAIGVALTAEEQADLSAFEAMLKRRKSELALCGRNRAFAGRIKTLQADILQIETQIADLRTFARYRSNV